nr:hypothetical protein [Tanacetum cinerariifolium]
HDGSRQRGAREGAEQRGIGGSSVVHFQVVSAGLGIERAERETHQATRRGRVDDERALRVVGVVAQAAVVVHYRRTAEARVAAASRAVALVVDVAASVNGAAGGRGVTAERGRLHDQVGASGRYLDGLVGNVVGLAGFHQLVQVVG